MYLTDTDKNVTGGPMNQRLLRTGLLLTLVLTALAACSPARTPSQPEEKHLSFHLQEIDWVVATEYDSLWASYRFPIFLADGQMLHLNWVSSIPVLSGYVLPDSTTCFAYQGTGGGYDVEESMLRGGTKAALGNIEIEVGGKPLFAYDEEHLPGGVYPPGYYTFVFFGSFPNEGENAVLDEKMRELERVKRNPTIEDWIRAFEEFKEETEWIGAKVEVTYWVENVER